MRHFTKIIVMASLATAALTSNAAAADFRSPDARDAARSVTVVDLRSPDARDAARSSDIAQMSAVTDGRSPDARDTSGVSTYQAGVPVQVANEVPATGFQWGDAGIGAAGMLGLIALFGGTLLLLGSHRRHRHVIG